MQVAVRFVALLHPNFEEEHPSGGQRPSTNLARGFAAQRLFRVPACPKGTIYLQKSMPFPGFEPRPYGTAISVLNYYTGGYNKLYSTSYGYDYCPSQFWSQSGQSLTVACYTRTFGDGPRHFEPRSSDEDDTSPNYYTTPTGGRLNSQQI
ncbi:hypothetical protein TNCV_2497421 [Trichonephila clavipes]|nr:hypothetical protein TNCV_2497421 [Trichonephila clavipes]